MGEFDRNGDALSGVSPPASGPSGDERSAAAARRRSTWQSVVGLGTLTLFLVAVSVVAARGNDERGLRVDVLSTRRAEPGETLDITVSSRDTFGAVTRVEVDFGDGSAPEIRHDDRGANCRSEFARTELFDFRHTYTGQGVVTVRATVTTAGCGAPTERVEAIRTIDIKPLRRPR